MSKKLQPHYADPRGTIIDVPGVGVMLASLAAAPTAAAPGYGKGCLFIDSSTGGLYRNTGTAASATWTAVGLGGQGAALTAAAADTVDGTYGTEEATVIGNLRTRVGEIEAVLESLGLVAAN